MVEEYRSITKNYSGGEKDKEFIIKYFVENYKKVSCSLCCIGFDNPEVIRLVLTNAECIGVLTENDAIQTLCYIGSNIDEKYEVIISCLSKSRKLFEKNKDILKRVFRRSYMDYFKRLINSKFVTINDIVDNLDIWDILSSSSCFDIFMEQYGDQIDQSVQKKLILDILETSSYSRGINNRDRSCITYRGNLLILMSSFKHAKDIDIHLVYMALCSSYPDSIRVQLATYFLSKIDTQLPIDSCEMAIVNKWMKEWELSSR